MSVATAPIGERKLVRLWRLVRHGLESDGRYKRYFLCIALVLGLIWLSTAAYLLLVPKSYQSDFTLILPGTGAGSSLNVESIGQAQSTSTSAFSSSTLSPTVNYKQLLSADVTLRAAAAIISEDRDAFSDPAIRLVDQTNMIEVSVSARTPAQARDRAEALRNAFLAQLDSLRADEAASREVSDAKNLEILSEKVREAQRKLIAFQAKHGLATLDQFNNRVAAVDSLRDKESDMRAQARQLGGTAGRLAVNLGNSPRSANIAMRLRGDPVFQQLAASYAASNADASLKAGTLGAQHGTMAQAESERSELRAALLARGRELTGLGDAAIISQIDLQLADGRSSLMQAMSLSDAQAAGTRAALASIRGDLARAQAESPKLIALASELADLHRDHRIAEAVFSSALARLDTNKLDPFASYPLVQTLAAPSLPKAPASPSLVIALAGAIAATLLTLVSFGLLWIRQPILGKLLRKD